MKLPQIKNSTFGLALVLGFSVIALMGCTQAERASHNISTEADNFNVVRRLAVINTITDKPQLEMVGLLSIRADAADSQLEVTVKDENGKFKKHFVGLTPTVTYVVEDISGTDVSEYRYQISYLPEAIIPVELKRG